MSGAREKVTDDPLSLFGNAPVERAKVTTTEDPLAMFGGSGGGNSNSGASSALFPEEAKKPVVKQEETVFKKLDETKISFAAPKKKKNDADAAAAAEVSPKNDKLGAAAWQSDLVQARNPKIDTTKDLLAELGLGGDSSGGANAGDGDEDLFGSSVSIVGDDFDSTQKKTNSGANVHIRGAADEAESSHNDLKVSAMLEREEDLDFGLFGKAKTQEKPKPLITKKNADIFEMESDEYFNELEKVATKKEKDITSSKSSSAVPAAPAPVTKEVNIDVSSLDLNDYIAQQSASSGGGLFD